MYIKVVKTTANLAPAGSNEAMFKGGTTNMRKKTRNGKMAYCVMKVRIEVPQ